MTATTLSEISAAIAPQPHVFIVGAPRSGSSLLYKLLQQHSSFRLKNTPDDSGIELTETKIFDYPYESYTNDSGASHSFMLDSQENYEHFRTATLPIQKFQASIPGKGLYQKVARRTNIQRGQVWKFLKNDRLIQTYFHYALKARGANRLLEKTPTHIFRMPEMRATFPNAKYLFIHRHPLDVFTSYRRRLKNNLELGLENDKYAGKSLDWLRISPEDFCKEYATYMTLALKAQQQTPDSFKIIRYSDLVKTPEEALTDALSFIGETFEPACIPDGPSSTVSQEDVARNKLLGKIEVKTKKWQDFISEEEAREIEQQLATMMQQFNYTSYLDSSA